MMHLTTQSFDADNDIERLQIPGDEAMNLTISLDEAMAGRLRRRASAKTLTPEQAAPKSSATPAPDG